MALLTFESPNSIAKIKNKLIVADTSYLITLSDANDGRNFLFDDFHFKTLNAGANFIINVIVRQEFIKKTREIQMIEAIWDLYTTNPLLQSRYHTVLNFKYKPLTLANLGSSNADKIYKDHVKQNDSPMLLAALKKNIWDDVKQFEKRANLTYFGGGGQQSWDDMGKLMQTTGLSATDAMIANFALAIGADGIITGDCDFAPLSDILDIYIPNSIASMCKIYDPAKD